MQTVDDVLRMRLPLATRGAKPIDPNPGPNRHERRKFAALVRRTRRGARAVAEPIRDRGWNERPYDVDEWLRLNDKA